jgi:hypothetical protein
MAATATLLGGCTYSEVRPYPAEWTPLVRQDQADFEALSGWYQDAGERDESGRVSLTMELFGFDAPWSKAKRVLVRADAESLQFQVWSDDAKLLDQTFSRSSGDYFVEGGNIRIVTHGKAVAEGFIGRLDGNVELFVQDGRLVMHDKSKSFGSGFFLLPEGHSSEYWYRFRKLSDQQ